MVQAKNGSIIATIIVCAVLIAGFVYLTMPETPVVNVPVVSVPTAAEIAALVKIPEIPAATAAEVDTTMIDRLCELTDGCEFYEIDYDITHNPETINPIDGGIAENVVLSKTSGSDFDKAIEKLIDVDRDDFEIISVEIKDAQIRAYSETDKEDSNYEVKAFVKVIIRDVDEADEESVYVLVTSVLDEGEYDSISIEEVNRRFEFA